MKQAVGLVRLSTKRQTAADRVSGAEQERAIRAWADREGYDLIDVLHETVSRNDELDPVHREGRPLFWSAWDRLVASDVAAIIFWEPSRFCAALDGADFPYWLAKASQHGDGIRFTEHEPPREGRYRTVMAAVAGSQAAADYQEIIERMMKGREGHARRGEFAGGALPFWIRWVRPVRAEGGGIAEPGRFELRDEHAPTALRIVDLYEGGKGSEIIANVLNEESVPTPSQVMPQWRKHPRRTTKWSGSTVLSILRNPALHGEYSYGSRRPTKNPKTRRVEAIAVAVPALIDKDRWEALQALMIKRRNYAGGRQRFDWPLQGLVWAEACERVYLCKPDGHTSRRVYRCRGRQARNRRPGAPPCQCPPLVADEIERLVTEALVGLVNNPAAQRKAVAEYVADLEGRRATLAARLQPTDDEIGRLQKLIDDLTMDVRTGRLSQERYDREVADIERERDTARSRRRDLADVQREQEFVENSLEGIEAALANGFKIDLGEEDVLSYDVDYATERQDGHRASYRLATLMEKLRLRIAVRRDGQVEITGFLQPTPVGASAITRPGARPTFRRSASRHVS